MCSLSLLMEKGLWLVKHTRTLLSSGLLLLVVVVGYPDLPPACVATILVVASLSN